MEAVELDKRAYLLGMIKDLVNIPSVTESTEENAPGLWIRERLAKLPYFKENPYHIKWIPTPLEGSKSLLHSLVVRVDAATPTNRTILMISHYDVVDVKIYGDLAKYAFDVDKITYMLSKTAEEEVIYGRGSMDMKCGVALEVDILEEFASNRKLFDVNIVAAFVGDEENASAGMRGVLPALAEMQADGTDFLAALNTEPGEAGRSGLTGPMIFLGTLGKIMPSFYVKGKAAHVGSCYQGFSSALAVSHIVKLAEGAPGLADPLHGRSQPSWICLDMSVLKEGTSVTVPDRAYAYFNCFTTTNSPAVVMEQMKEIAADAFAAVSRQHADSCRGLLARGYEGAEFDTPDTKVYTLEELICEARKKYGGDFDSDLHAYIESIPPGDMRERGVKTVDKICDMNGCDGPYVVCFFLPPWMPVRTDFSESPRDIAAIEAARRIEAELLEKHGLKMTEVELFAGLCDLSYVGGKCSDKDLAAYKENVPGWGSIYNIPLLEMNGLGMPVINLGPSGEDPHKKGEKLYLHYSLEILPQLLRSIVRELSALIRD